MSGLNIPVIAHGKNVVVSEKHILRTQPIILAFSKSAPIYIRISRFSRSQMSNQTSSLDKKFGEIKGNGNRKGNGKVRQSNGPGELDRLTFPFHFHFPSPNPDPNTA